MRLRFRETLKARLAAVRHEFGRLVRLHRFYCRAAAQGWRVQDCGHWEFYMYQDKHPHVRVPPSGTCEWPQLEEVLRRRP